MLRCTYVGNRSKLKDQLLANDSLLCWGKKYAKKSANFSKFNLFKKRKRKEKRRKKP